MVPREACREPRPVDACLTVVAFGALMVSAVAMLSSPPVYWAAGPFSTVDEFSIHLLSAMGVVFGAFWRSNAAAAATTAVDWELPLPRNRVSSTRAAG